MTDRRAERARNRERRARNRRIAELLERVAFLSTTGVAPEAYHLEVVRLRDAADSILRAWMGTQWPKRLADLQSAWVSLAVEMDTVE